MVIDGATMNRIALLAVIAALVTGCALTSHATMPSPLGTPRSSADLLAVIDQPGTVTLESVTSADWEVDRGGLVNLEHPKAKAAGLVDGPEPIQVSFHALRHPTKGLFIVDTGVEVKLRDAPGDAALGGLVASVMHLEKMQFRAPLGDWLKAQPQPLAGVLLTHAHPDHVSGLPDVPKGTPIHSGPGELAASSFQYLFSRAAMNRCFDGHAPVGELAFQPDPGGRFEGVLDLFGDGEVWVLWVPGHTPGSVAFVVRTPSGPVLLIGDTSHTAWGWENDVEPGRFTSDHAKNLESLAKLRALAHEHPNLSVRLGHQHLPGAEGKAPTPVVSPSP